MRLLDRLVSDLVQNATGYNVRGLVRRVGGRNILLVGGALLAGGAIAAESQRRSTATPAMPVPSGGRAMPPPPLPTPTPTAPPPPLPGTTAAGSQDLALPPLPLAPTVSPSPESAAADDAAVLSNATLFAVVRTMVAAALADGELAAAEKALIEEHLETSVGEEGGLRPEQIARVRKDLVIPPSPTEIVQGLPADEDEELLLRFAVLVIRADGEASERERAFLEAFGAALGMAPERRSAIEAEIFPVGGSRQST